VEIFFRLFEHRHFINFLLGFAGILVVIWVIIYEPVTRHFVAQDRICTYCHLEWEYVPTAKRSATRPHLQEASDKLSQATCVQCHLPEGWWNATYAYFHFLSVTDLFGHFRDRDAERAGDWIPPRAAMADRARLRMFENDSVTCRSCHIEAEIKPKRARGVNAHQLALTEKKTCIECHNNLVHREVRILESTFKKSAEAAN